MGYNILVIPPNDLLRHPIPNRLYHILSILSKRHHIYLLSYPKHPLSSKTILRSMDCIEIIYKAFSAKDLGLYYIVNAANIESAISDTMNRVNIDLIIHANIIPSYIALRHSLKNKIPSIYDFMDYYVESAKAYYTNTLSRILCSTIVNNIVSKNVRYSSHIVTVSYTLYHILRRVFKYNRDVSIIPNGVNDTLFKAINKSRAREYLGVDPDLKILLYYGSIDVWVDFKPLFLAIRELRDRSVRLWIIGFPHNISYFFYLKRLIELYRLDNFIRFIKAVDQECLVYYISASDVVVAPYSRILKNYGVPLKIVESLACGKPVVTTDIREFMLWFRDYPVYYYRDYRDLASILNKLLFKEYPSNSVLNRTSIAVKKRFSWKRHAKQYEAIINKLVENI